jgi:hypothetical protein
VGHGSNAVGWGRVVPSNPRPGRPFWTSVTAPSLAAILWKPSHFVCNCPSRVPGSSARLVRGRPCKQLPKPAEGGGGGEVNCLENHPRSKHCPLATATRSNPSAYQIPAASTSPNPHKSVSPDPHGGRGERSASPGPRRRVRLTTPTPFPLPSAHTTMCRNTLRPILCCTGALRSTGARGGELTLMWHPPPVSRTPFPSPPPFPPSFTPILPPSHPPT